MDTIDSVWLNFEKFTNKPFQSKLIDVKKLSGGLVNHVYRLVFENNSTAVLKYFPKFLAFDNTVEMSQNRYFIEKTALELIGNNEHLQNTLVRVPKLLYSSDKHFTIIMEVWVPIIQVVVEIVLQTHTNRHQHLPNICQK